VAEDPAADDRVVSQKLALGLSIAVLGAAALIGLAVAGGRGAIGGVLFAFGLVMVGVAAWVLSLTIRARNADEDWAIVVGYVFLRAGSGLAAIWLALGGGSTAAWTLVAFVAVYPIWMTVMRRRRDIT